VLATVIRSNRKLKLLDLTGCELPPRGASLILAAYNEIANTKGLSTSLIVTLSHCTLEPVDGLADIPQQVMAGGSQKVSKLIAAKVEKKGSFFSLALGIGGFVADLGTTIMDAVSKNEDE